MPALLFLAATPLHRPTVDLRLGPLLGLPELLFPVAAVALVVLARQRGARPPLAQLGVLALGLSASVLTAPTAGRAAAQLGVLLYVSSLYSGGAVLVALGRRDAALRALLIGAALACAAGLLALAIPALGEGGLGLAARYPWMGLRPIGPTESPVMLSLIALAGLAALGALRRAGAVRRGPALSFLSLFGITLIAGQSRVLLAAALGCALLARARSGQRRGQAAATVVAVGAVLLTLVTLVWRVVPLTRDPPFVDTHPSPYRVCHEIALRAFWSRPLTGVGLEGFHAVWPRHYQPRRHDSAYSGGAEALAGRPRDPHSTPLGYLAEAGLPALAVLIGIAQLTWRRRDRRVPEIAAYLAALALASLSVDLLTERTTWALLGLFTRPPET